MPNKHFSNDSINGRGHFQLQLGFAFCLSDSTLALPSITDLWHFWSWPNSLTAICLCSRLHVPDGARLSLSSCAPGCIPWPRTFVSLPTCRGPSSPKGYSMDLYLASVFVWGLIFFIFDDGLKFKTSLLWFGRTCCSLDVGLLLEHALKKTISPRFLLNSEQVWKWEQTALFWAVREISCVFGVRGGTSSLPHILDQCFLKRLAPDQEGQHSLGTC